MSDASRIAFDIGDRVNRPPGELAPLAEIERALDELRTLQITDSADQIVIRDVTHTVELLRQAASVAESTSS